MLAARAAGQVAELDQTCLRWLALALSGNSTSATRVAAYDPWYRSTEPQGIAVRRRHCSEAAIPSILYISSSCRPHQQSQSGSLLAPEASSLHPPHIAHCAEASWRLAGAQQIPRIETCDYQAALTCLLTLASPSVSPLLPGHACSCHLYIQTFNTSSRDIAMT